MHNFERSRAKFNLEITAPTASWARKRNCDLVVCLRPAVCAGFLVFSCCQCFFANQLRNRRLKTRPTPTVFEWNDSGVCFQARVALLEVTARQLSSTGAAGATRS